MQPYEKEIEIDFSSTYAPGQLRRQLDEYVEQGWSDFVLKAQDGRGAYPNTCVPIAGIIDYYRTKGCGFTCDWSASSNSYISHTRLEDPFGVGTDEGLRRLSRPLDVVWMFENSTDIKRLVDATRDHICEIATVEKGILPGIEWCLYEIMDNVLQHSEAPSGYYMGQFTSTNSRLSLCVFDNGRGIFNSLKSSKRHSPKTPLDAITLALQERVTRDESIGQGNGMWGFSESVRLNGGSYSVSSDGARVSFVNDKVDARERAGFFYGSDGLGTTLIDFQLDCARPLDIARALKQDPTQLWLEEMEDPSGTAHVISIAEESAGTGTRQAAEKIRHKTINIIREGCLPVVLDFENVNMVSSSYADELVGKLVAEIGFSIFNNYCFIKHLTNLNQQVIDRSVQQRMAQEFYDEPPMDDDVVE